MTADWGYLTGPQRPVIDLLCSSPDEQKRLGRRQDVVCTDQTYNLEYRDKEVAREGREDSARLQERI